jgi:hypothetical protein
VQALSPPAAPGSYTFFENVASHPFNPQDASVRLDTAWWLMDAAFLSYSPNPIIERTFTEAIPGATVTCFGDPHRSTQAYVASSADWIVAVFRGTQVDDFWSSTVDWSVDARFVPVPDSHGNLVHAGFLAAVGDVWPAISGHVRNLQAEHSRPFWITGHSLGAALATLAANKCADEPKHLGLRGMYTFGSPRVGDARFGRRIPVSPWRFRNNSDLVTHVPIGLVFRHIGHLEFIDGGGHWHQEPNEVAQSFLELAAPRLSPGEAHALSTVLSFSSGGVPLPGILADHAPINYAIRIWNAFASRA